VCVVQVGDVLMLKSGSEFREFSVLTVKFPASAGCPTGMAAISSESTLGRHERPVTDVMQCKVTQEDRPDEAMLAIVQRYLSKVSPLCPCGGLIMQACSSAVLYHESHCITI
jgi:hypothetical protein